MSKVRVITCLFLLLASQSALSESFKIATWNMKWLGTNSGNSLDPVENVPLYGDTIRSTGASLFALQEIGATHSKIINGAEEPRCFYLDLIVDNLNENAPDSQWTYLLDRKNKNQRLAYLFKSSEWEVSNPRSIWPGKSYRSSRRPLVADFKSTKTEFDLSLINVHFKAFPDEKSKEKRSKNILELAKWISSPTNILDSETLIAGDTNIYASDGAIETPLISLGYTLPQDDEATAIHENRLGERFDRFYLSPGLSDELSQAIADIGPKDVIDAISPENEKGIEWFDKEISDHLPVVIVLKSEQSQ